jgi:hypothetical protein
LSYDARNDQKPHTIFTSSKAINAVARFQNNGNIQEAPFGKVTLMKGSKVIGSYEINPTVPPSNALPGTTRLFAVPLTKVSSFGKYTLQGNFGYGSNGQLLSAKTSFYVIPGSFILAVVILLVALVLAIFLLPRWIRAYNRSVLRRASRHRR